MRSQLWSVDAQVTKGTVPTVGEMMKSASPGFDGDSYDAQLPGRQRDSLY